jgi:hypothetical protein
VIRRYRTALLGAAALAALSACSTLRSVASGGCPAEWRPLLVTNHSLQVTPGQVVPLGRPYVLDGPFGEKEVDEDCPVLWRVQGGAARVRGGVLSVPADAEIGSSFTVLVYAAKVWGRQAVDVVSPAPNPLAGTWSQSGQECPPLAAGMPRIGELIFLRNGRYSYTRQPFERVYDYWGTYRYDAAAGKLRLSEPQGGTDPRADSEHAVRFTDAGALVIADYNGMPGCSTTFERSGGEP